MSFDDDDCDEVNDDSGQSNETEEHHDSELLETHERPEDFSIDVDPIDVCSAAEGPGHGVSFGWTGFKIVGDNIDKNLRPSYISTLQSSNSVPSLFSFMCCWRPNRPFISVRYCTIACFPLSLCYITKCR